MSTLCFSCQTQIVLAIVIIGTMIAYHMISCSGANRGFAAGRANYIMQRLGEDVQIMDFEGYRKFVPDLDAVEYRAIRNMVRAGDTSTMGLQKRLTA